MSKGLRVRWSHYRQQLMAAVDRCLLTEKSSSGRNRLARCLDRVLLVLSGWLLAAVVLAYWLQNLFGACLLAAAASLAVWGFYRWLRQQWLVQARRRQNTAAGSGVVLPTAVSPSGGADVAETGETAVVQEQTASGKLWSGRLLQRSRAKAYFKAAAILLLFSWLFNDTQTVQIFYAATAALNLGLAVACLAQKKMAASETAAADKP